ncbi:MAG: winged helix-turn-helix domain-containing protein [Deltaproteobacteria bacterium]|nr:winged helix-turn-helix domain-containing protein [Deltaproteobacteria bacterium]
MIVEDEPDLARLVEFNLQQAGFATEVHGRCSDALSAAMERPPSLVLLDLMLPDGSGVDVCRALKNDPRTRSVPVMMVTARGEEVDRIVGFELGADDYVVKPFSVRELVLRVRAILRRASPERDDTDSSDASVTFGILRLDRRAYRVFVESREVVLTALEFRLLDTLLERKNRVQSRETLLEDVWGIRSSVETRTVDTHIKRLREKLGPAGAYVHTVRGVGYRFAESPEDLEV